MTLEEKYKKATSQWFNTKECEQIAENYVVEVMERLIKIWQERQNHYENLAEKHKDNEQNFKKFTYKALATRDCWKELLTDLKKNPT